jgi:NosR/NirI family nitrous oxide reductase transcriptional regulator
MAMRQEPRGRLGMLLGHMTRLALVAATAWMVHATFARRVSRAQAFDLVTVSPDTLRPYLPEAATIGAASYAVGGGLDVLDGAGERVGTILRTSPAGDSCIGFSGPTDVLVVCDASLRVAGVKILASRDTRDHVRAIERDPAFLASLAGRPWPSLPREGRSTSTPSPAPRSRAWPSSMPSCFASAARPPPGSRRSPRSTT